MSNGRWRRFSRCGWPRSLSYWMSYEKRRANLWSPIISIHFAEKRGSYTISKTYVVVLCGLPLVSRLLRGNLCVQWIKTDKLELGREAACDLAPRAGATGGAGKRDNNNVWRPAKWRLLLFSAVTHHLPLFIIVITPWKKCKTGRAATKAVEGVT